jgi:hypothetical protein
MPEVLDFYRSLGFELLESTEVRAEYSRREGGLLSLEGYLVPVWGMRRG